MFAIPRQVVLSQLLCDSRNFTFHKSDHFCDVIFESCTEKIIISQFVTLLSVRYLVFSLFTCCNEKPPLHQIASATQLQGGIVFYFL